MGFLDRMGEKAGKEFGKAKERYEYVNKSAENMNEEKIARKIVDSSSLVDRVAYAKALQDKRNKNSNDD